MKLAIFLCVLCVAKVFGIKLKIDALIDLGNDWNYKYIISQVTTPRYLRGHHDDREIDELKSTESQKITDEQVYRSSNEPRHGHKLISKVLRIVKTKDKNKHQSNSARDDENLSIFHEKLSKEAKNKGLAVKDFVRVKSRSEESDYKGQVTKIHNSNVNKNKLFVAEKKVTDIYFVKRYIFHIYKQALKVLNTMNRNTDKTDAKAKRGIKLVKKVYKHKFATFLNETGKHFVKTRSGSQKVILNAMDTSSRILKRLVNQITDVRHRFSFLTELDHQHTIENIHACYSLNICRTKTGYSEFWADILLILLQTNDAKIKQGSDALTEAMKNLKSDVLDKEAQNLFKHAIEEMESWPPMIIRGFYLITRAVINFKDMPIYIVNDLDAKLSNKTVAFRELLNIFDEIEPKAETEKEWKIIKQELEEWKDSKRKDILEIMEKIANTFNTMTNKMTKTVKERLNGIVKILTTRQLSGVLINFK